MVAKIEIEGVEKLNGKLNALADDFWKQSGRNDAQSVMKRSLYRLVFELANYPQQRAGSTYIRTGTLGRRWTSRIRVQVQSDGVQGSIGNNTEYAPQVQSARFQARVHRGRWITDEKAIEKQRRAIEDDFQSSLRAKVEFSR